MSHWEATGMSDEWYTPKYIFDALGCRFDLDPANDDPTGRHVPCNTRFGGKGLQVPWFGFVWLNPPFGGRNEIRPWLQKFFEHGNGIALTPDRTSAPWWQEAAREADAILFVAGKIHFERRDGSAGVSPSTGTTLMASGELGVLALNQAERNKLGVTFTP